MAAFWIINVDWFVRCIWLRFFYKFWRLIIISNCMYLYDISMDINDAIFGFSAIRPAIFVINVPQEICVIPKVFNGARRWISIKVLGFLSQLNCFYKLCWLETHSCFKLWFHVRYIPDNPNKIWVVWIWDDFDRVKSRRVARAVTKHSNTTSSQLFRGNAIEQNSGTFYEYLIYICMSNNMLFHSN